MTECLAVPQLLNPSTPSASHERLFQKGSEASRHQMLQIFQSKSDSRNETVHVWATRSAQKTTCHGLQFSPLLPPVSRPDLVILQRSIITRVDNLLLIPLGNDDVIEVSWNFESAFFAIRPVSYAEALLHARLPCPVVDSVSAADVTSPR